MIYQYDRTSANTFTHKNNKNKLIMIELGPNLKNPNKGLKLRGNCVGPGIQQDS